MNNTRALLAMTAISFALCACGGPEATTGEPADAKTIAVVGSIAYRERIALPPDAVATISVNDVSRADAASAPVARQVIPLEGRQVPIAFELAVPGDDIEPRSSYAVRAVIRDRDERLLWTTDTVYPLSFGAGADSVDVGMLRLVNASREAMPLAGDTSLTGHEWVVEDIDGRGIVDRSRATLQFGDDGTLSGRASCNTYTGSYTLDGADLDTGQLAVTLRSCPEALARQEETFLAILRDAERISIDATGALIVTASSGATLLARAEQ